MSDSLDKSALLDAAPVVPPAFYGAITYRFEAGRLVVAQVEETLKPAGAVAVSRVRVGK